MKLVQRLRARWSIDRDLADELNAHIDERVEELTDSGVSSEEARWQARRELGNATSLIDRGRDVWRFTIVEDAWQDFVYAWRQLRRAPAFAAAAIATLALGIGANTAIFAILNSLILRPLPVRSPSELVELLSGTDGNAWTYPLWREIQARPDMFGGAVAWGSPSVTPFALIDGGALTPVSVYTVSGDFCRILGIEPARGRLLTPLDDVRAGSSGGFAAVISDAFWRSHFAASADVIGTVLNLNRSPVTIVGVTRPEFFGPEVGRSFDIMVPLNILPKALLDQRGFFWLSVMARLRPGQSVEEASQRLRVAQADLRAATIPPGLRPDQLREYLAEPFRVERSSTGPSVVRTKYRDPLLVIMAAVVVLLLIACANVAHLLLARSDSRRREFSVRVSLGASGARIARQLLVESLLLSALGGAAGCLVATWGSRILVSQLATSRTHVSLALPLDWHVIGFTLAVSLGTVVLVALMPAVRVTRLQPSAVLPNGSRTVTVGSRSWLTYLLVASQAALSLVLCVGAGLLVRTFVALTTADLGFNPRPVLIASIRPRPGATISDGALDHVLDVLRGGPGVATAAYSGFTTPMSGIRHDDLLENPPGLSLSERERRAFFRDAGVGWFDVMGMRLVLGRTFTPADNANPESVAVINEALARRFFPRHNPIGQVVREAAPPGGVTAPRVVVGVVADAVYNSAREGVLPALYRFIPRSSTLVVRASGGDAATIARDVSTTIAGSDSAFLSTVTPMAEQARDTIAQERLVAILSGLFAGTALLLASVGIYGVSAYVVGRRRPEIAVRRALGAASAGIAKSIVGGTISLVAVGIGAGMMVSFWLMNLLRPFLYGLGPRDPTTLGLVGLLLATVALLASWIPARRAINVDPAAILREG